MWADRVVRQHRPAWSGRARCWPPCATRHAGDAGRGDGQRRRSPRALAVLPQRRRRRVPHGVGRRAAPAVERAGASPASLGDTDSRGCCSRSCSTASTTGRAAATRSAPWSTTVDASSTTGAPQPAAHRRPIDRGHHRAGNSLFVLDDRVADADRRRVRAVRRRPGVGTRPRRLARDRRRRRPAITLPSPGGPSHDPDVTPTPPCASTSTSAPTTSPRALRADAAPGSPPTPKALPPKWFYDERGCELFDEITRLPEYYPTRAERAILDARTRAEIARADRRRHAGRAGLGHVGEDPAAPRRALRRGHAATVRAVRRERADAARRRGGDRRRVPRHRGARRRRRLRAPPRPAARRRQPRGRVPRRHDRQPRTRRSGQSSSPSSRPGSDPATRSCSAPTS